MVACSEDFLSGDDFDAVLTIFRFYGYGANASEAVEKIAADKKDYHMLPLLYSLYSISVSIILEKIVY